MKFPDAQTLVACEAHSNLHSLVRAGEVDGNARLKLDQLGVQVTPIPKPVHRSSVRDC